MNKPFFSCGTVNCLIEHPSNWDVNPIVGKFEETSIGGNSMRDISFRKYGYTLQWDFISKEDYDKLEELYNYHLDSNFDVVFTYPKWWQTEFGTTCKMSLSPRGFKAGSGNVTYYSSVTVDLVEVAKR